MPALDPLGRRAVLRAALGGALGAAFAGLAGCSSDGSGGQDDPAAAPAPDPDPALVAAIVADKRALLARYDATTGRFGGLRGLLEPLREDHVGHLEALGASAEAPAAPPGPTAGPTPGDPGSTGPGTEPAPEPPADRERAVRALADAERGAARRRVRQCEAARSGDLARLVAAIGGCEAAHHAVLDEAGRA